MTAAASKNRKPARRPNLSTFSDEVRSAIEKGGSAYAIGAASGVAPAVLSRFLSGQRSMTLDTLDRLAPVLGLHLAVATRPRGRPKAVKVPLPLAEDAGSSDHESPADERAGAVPEIPSASGCIPIAHSVTFPGSQNATQHNAEDAGSPGDITPIPATTHDLNSTCLGTGWD